MAAFDPGFTPGTVIDNSTLTAAFQCGPQGGMRRSHRTNTLVLTSGHVDVVYEDRWVGDVLHYTGMGLRGPQDLTVAQNRTLAESRTSGIDVHLFEVHREKEYTYVGRVELIADPYPAQQPDADGNPRQVYVFPLRVTNGVPPIKREVFLEEEARRVRSARGLSDEDLAARAKAAAKTAGSRPVTGQQFERDPYVVEYVKRHAAGVCDLCEARAPFVTADGLPYLEVHHIVWLARGGEDSIGNCVALCPNCHRKMHLLDLASDRGVLLTKVSSRHDRSRAPAALAD